jgi:hypothetical protein
MEISLMSSQAVKPNRLFVPAAVGTVVMGIGAAVLLIVHMQQPAPVVIKTPVDRIIRVPVPAVPVPAPLPPPPPPPPPVVVAAPPPPPVERVLSTVPKEKSVLEGVWRRKESPLPMFKVSEDGQEGTCAANWGTIVPWRNGSANGDVLEFVVDEEIIRAHVRMTLTAPGKARVEQWVTDNDWMVSLQRANKGAKTPLQRKAIKTELLQNATKYRKPVVIGIFIRQPAD